MQDRRCRFGLAARIEMVQRRQGGESLRAIASSLACSPSTVRTNWLRWEQADAGGRADFSCLAPRRPVPKSCPHALSAEQQQRIVDARQRTNWGPMRLAALTGFHRATIWKVLRRHGCSRRRRPGRQTFKRFEWSQPGALLHIDAYKAPRFDAPGHRVKQRDYRGRKRGMGHTVVIAVQDDHTRLVYAELHRSENAANVSITLTRAASWFVEQGCGPVEAVMSDNAFAYTKGPLFAGVLDDLGARHIRIPPYTPRGTASSSGSSAPSKTNGRTPANGPTPPPATARCPRSSDTSTATDLTAPPTADHPSPASTKSAGRTASSVQRSRLGSRNAWQPGCDSRWTNSSARSSRRPTRTGRGVTRCGAGRPCARANATCSASTSAAPRASSSSCWRSSRRRPS